MNHENVITTSPIPKAHTASFGRYRALVEGIVETRKKIDICRSMKDEARVALGKAIEALGYNEASLADAEAELAAIESQCLA